MTRAGDTSIIRLPILCFNDVYRVEQRYNPPTPAASTNTPAGGAGPSATTNPPQSKQEQKITVGQFARTLLDIRDSWPKRDTKQYAGATKDVLQRSDEEAVERDGLVLFAGDVFNPSVESSVTRGSHMVPIMNALKVDVACVGNHDFDFGYPHLTTLIGSTKFPWLLSNIVDTKTGKQPDAVKRFSVYERCGARIGVIGLVEKDWIATIPSWPETFQYRDMAETALSLSKELRDPAGPHKVDLIIALTHCRLPNDVDLANTLGAVKDTDPAKHGVDLLIGGHDHIYYIGRGAESWQNFERDTKMRGVDKDQGVHLIKSGTDFRDLSEATLELARTGDDSVRRMVIKGLSGKHHEITPDTPTSIEVEDLTKSLLSTVTKTLTKPVCFTLTPFDVRSEIVRTQESAVGNWIADVLLHAYSEMIEDAAPESEAANGKGKGHSTVFDKEGAPSPKDRRQADCTIICGGTLRGDSQYGPGKITLGDILEILPFEDPAVCLEIDGKGIWDCLESALSKWPAQEGRFPIVSGLAVKWDHTKPPMQRVISVHLLQSDSMLDDPDETESPGDPVDFVEQEDGTVIEVKKRPLRLGEPVENKEGGRMYRLITREYMAEGYDGFGSLKGRRFIVDDDNGQIMSSIIRSFLLGSAYIFRHKQLREEHTKHRSKQTDRVLNKARSRFQRDRMGQTPNGSPATDRKLDSHGQGATKSPPLSPTSTGIHVVEHSPHDIRDALRTARSEHMSEIDALDGKTLRANRPNSATANGDSAVGASFLVDSRNRSEIQSMDLDLAIVSPLIDGRLKDVSEDVQ